MNRTKGFILLIVVFVIALIVIGKYYLFNANTHIGSETNSLLTLTPGEWCGVNETQFVLVVNEPQVYNGITLTNYPWEGGLANITLQSQDKSLYANVLMAPDDPPAMYDQLTVRIPDADPERAIVCVSDTKITFQDIVTPQNVMEYLPPVESFDWNDDLASTTGWKTYNDSEFAFTFKYPAYWYGKDRIADPDNVYLDPPCRTCGGFARGLYIAKYQNEDHLTPAQYYVKNNCGSNLNELKDVGACGNLETEYSIENRPDNLKEIESYMENGAPGGGSPGIRIYFKNSKGQIISISADGVPDDEMTTILTTLSVK